MSEITAITKLLEPTVTDIVTFINETTLSMVGRFTKSLLDQSCKDEINSTSKKIALQRRVLSPTEIAEIKQKYEDAKPRVTQLFTQELKVLNFNVCTIVLISNSALMALGLISVTPALVGSLAVVAVIRSLYARAIESDTSALQRNLEKSLNWGFKKLDEWLGAGKVKIVSGQKAYGIFRQSIIFTKMTGTEVIV